jgi:hypothetical protein
VNYTRERGYRTGVYKSNTVAYITGYLSSGNDIFAATVRLGRDRSETLVPWSALNEVA